MMFVSSSSTAVVVHVVPSFVVDEVEGGKNKDFLVDFVAKRLKKKSRLMMMS